ncbi:5850_t:CDS:2 [Funneliformis mosseae]|uniref:5850_t:CDS:1 n=1 Tax=Funneliformis mosseae TaxID=27381 RepID=A0A9N8V0U0_FUNMO|nr:5850_t:CDS:2 [Funneliformis mosseae]
MEPMTDEAIISNFIETIVGGLDTISGSLCYINYCMALYPEAKKRLLKEVDLEFPHDQKLTYKDLNKLPYCDAILISVWIPEKNLNCFIIPAETKLFIHQYGTNKHKAHWSNPEEFDHDRLLIANQNFSTPIQRWCKNVSRIKFSCHGIDSTYGINLSNIP